VVPVAPAVGHTSTGTPAFVNKQCKMGMALKSGSLGTVNCLTAFTLCFQDWRTFSNMFLIQMKLWHKCHAHWSSCPREQEMTPGHILSLVALPCPFWDKVHAKLLVKLGHLSTKVIIFMQFYSEASGGI
jgi:hypothetical protein